MDAAGLVSSSPARVSVAGVAERTPRSGHTHCHPVLLFDHRELTDRSGRKARAGTLIPGWRGECDRAGPASASTTSTSVSFWADPAELVQLDLAPERPLVGGGRVGQQLPDGPGQVICTPWLEKQHLVIAEVMPHGG